MGCFHSTGNLDTGQAESTISSKHNAAKEPDLAVHIAASPARDSGSTEGTPASGYQDNRRHEQGLNAFISGRYAESGGRRSLDDLRKKAQKGAVDETPMKRERRVGYGNESVREQIKRMAIGGGTGTETEEDFYAISSSESSSSSLDERFDDVWPAYSGPGIVVEDAKPEENSEMIGLALESSLVFRGIDPRWLHEVISAMVLVQLPSGATVIHQGALPGPDDCMYLLASGQIDVVITGGGDQAGKNEDRLVEGNKIKIRKETGWLFGDVALLFNSQRSASVVAATDITLWALNGRFFSKFVLHHAPGAQRLRFVRKMPLLKGLSDNALQDVAGRMTEEEFKKLFYEYISSSNIHSDRPPLLYYPANVTVPTNVASQDGELLIRMGERGAKLYLIRSGQICVTRPAEQAGSPATLLAVLGRGQFVGERTLVTGKLRTADCVAKGDVKVVVMSKKDFQDLDNPLLAWMIDYDAVATVLKGLPIFRPLIGEELEAAFDSFERKEHKRGDVLCEKGKLMDHLGILRLGEIASPAGDTLQESGGFTFYGANSGGLQESKGCTAALTVASEQAVTLSISFDEVKAILGRILPMGNPREDPLAAQTLRTAMKRCPIFSKLDDAALQTLALAMLPSNYSSGDLVAPSGAAGGRIYYIARGAVLSTKMRLPVVPGTSKILLTSIEGDDLAAGALVGQQSILEGGQRLESLVAQKNNTQIFLLTKKAAEIALGYPLTSLISISADSQPARRADGDLRQGLDSDPRIDVKDLLLGETVGTGQFGLVKIAHMKRHPELYALKIMHKAPLTEAKQIEHVINERKILGAANSRFCVSLEHAFQDASHLYLLQEWVAGGELFHYLDIEGAFSDNTAQFYAANVLLALEHLHSQGIVYRDLKPENLLIDQQGYIKVADFGFAKEINSQKTFTICGTPDYQAPEIILRKGTTYEADYWAFGVLIFEMLVGEPPFKSLSGDPWDTFRQTLSGRFYVPPAISPTAADLIYKLLQVNPEKRLGSGSGGIKEIKNHNWFADLDWNAIQDRKLASPFLPEEDSQTEVSKLVQFKADSQPSSHGRKDIFAEEWVHLWEWIDQEEAMCST